MDIGLARVSTLDQDPQLQLDALVRAGCDHVYQEHGVSGVAAKRPVRDQVLAQLRPSDTLTVWKLDRIGRSMVEVVSIVKGLADRGVRFRSLTDNLVIAPDKTSPMTMMQLQMLAIFGEYERSIIRERTMAGKRLRMASGKHPGGARMYGWSADHEEIIEHEAEVLRRVALDLIDGQPFARVVDRLNTQGVPPVKADRWRVNTVQNILLNRRVIPIIGQEHYDRLAQLLIPKRRPGAVAVNLLSGLLHCGRPDCGQPMYAATSNGKRVYRCHRLGGGRFSGCGRSTVSLARADDWAREAFLAACTGPEFVDSLNQRQAELLAGDVTTAQLDDWRAERDEIEVVLPTRFGTPDLRQRHDELQRMVRQATATLVQRPDLQALLDLPQSEAQLRELWAGWDISARRAWLKRLFKFVVVQPATAKGRASDVESRMAPVWIA
jgi:DNA invertase Pin-like site-specific DNA recombinase